MSLNISNLPKQPTTTVTVKKPNTFSPLEFIFKLFAHHFKSLNSFATRVGVSSNLSTRIKEWTPKQWKNYATIESEHFKTSTLFSTVQWLKSDKLKIEVSSLPRSPKQIQKAVKTLQVAQELFKKIDSNTRLTTHEKFLMYSKVVNYVTDHKSIKALSDSKVANYVTEHEPIKALGDSKALSKLNTLTSIINDWTPEKTLDEIKKTIPVGSAIQKEFQFKVIFNPETIDENTYAELLDDLDAHKTELKAKESTERPILTTGASSLNSKIDINVIRTLFVTSILRNMLKMKKLSEKLMTPYEYISLQIQGFREVDRYKKEIVSRLNPEVGEYGRVFGGKAEPAGLLMEKVSGLAIHGKKNAETLPMYLAQGPSMLLKSYKLAKSEGRLSSFFKDAFETSSACYEARFSTLQNYVTSNLKMDLSLTPDYDSKTATKEKVIGAYLEAYREISLRAYVQETTGNEYDYQSKEWESVKNIASNEDKFDEKYMNKEAFKSYLETTDITSITAFGFTADFSATDEKSIIQNSDIDTVIELYENYCML
jgi:hypothetical protein